MMRKKRRNVCEEVGGAARDLARTHDFFFWALKHTYHNPPIRSCDVYFVMLDHVRILHRAMRNQFPRP